MGVDGPSGSEKIQQFPRSPALLRDSKRLLDEASQLIQEKYSMLYRGSVIAGGGVAEPRNKRTEQEALGQAKAMFDELGAAVKELEGDKLDNAKYEVAKDAKESLERSLDALKSLA